jgi:uncharacterized membrane protein
MDITQLLTAQSFSIWNVAAVVCTEERAGDRSGEMVRFNPHKYTELPVIQEVYDRGETRRVQIEF